MIAAKINYMDALLTYLNSLGGLNPSTLGLFLPHIQEVTLSKNSFFVKEGEVSKEIGILTNGIVRSFITTAEGKEYNKTLFAAPAIIGSYVSFITGQPNRLPQQALTDCTVLKFPLELLETLSENNIEIERLRRKIAERFFVLKEKRELEMVLLQAEERYQIFQKEYPGVEQEIPQYHIASYLGITPTQLSRIRKSMSTKK